LNCELASAESAGPEEIPEVQGEARQAEEALKYEAQPEQTGTTETSETPENSAVELVLELFPGSEEIPEPPDELEAERVEASSGGGVVRAVATGAGELLEVIISPEVVDPEDVEMLQDLVVTAVRDAIERANQLRQEKIQEALGPLAAFAGQIPGLF